MGTNDIARGDLEHIKCDYMHLEAMVKGMGAQVTFSLIFPVRSKGFSQGLLTREEWKDPVGQQLVAQLVMTIGICIL